MAEQGHKYKFEPPSKGWPTFCSTCGARLDSDGFHPSGNLCPYDNRMTEPCVVADVCVRDPQADAMCGLLCLGAPEQ